MEKDTGNWLSAQQAVMPDGSEVGELRLVNKKLPPLVPAMPEKRSGQAVYNAAIDFAIEKEADGIAFLRLWRAGDAAGIASEFPDFQQPQPHAAD